MNNKTSEMLYAYYRFSNKNHLSRTKQISFAGLGAFQPASLHFIELVAENKNMNVSDIALELGITKGAVTQLATKLQKKGMISSVKKVENRKCTFYRLTEQGKALYLKQQEYQKGLKAEVDTLLADYSDAEVESAIRLLYRLERCIGEYHKQF